jgi:predicted AAA+ superfamily ATPase
LEYGRTAETAVHAHLASFVRRRGGELTYWRDARGEVDFVVTLPDRKPLPVEVTIGAEGAGKLGNLLRCARDVGSRQVLVLSMADHVTSASRDGIAVHEWPLPAFLWNMATEARPGPSSECAR